MNPHEFPCLRGKNNKYSTCIFSIPAMLISKIMECHPFDEKEGMSVKNKGNQRHFSRKVVKKKAEAIEQQLSLGQVLDLGCFLGAAILGLGIATYVAARNSICIQKKMWILDGNHRMEIISFVLKNPDKYPLFYEYIQNNTVTVHLVTDVSYGDAQNLFLHWNAYRIPISRSQKMAYEGLGVMRGEADGHVKIRNTALEVMWDNFRKNPTSPFYNFVNMTDRETEDKEGIKPPLLSELVRTSQSVATALEMTDDLMTDVWKLSPKEAYQVYCERITPWFENIWKVLAENMPVACNPVNEYGLLSQGYKIINMILGCYVRFVTSEKFIKKMGVMTLEEKQQTFMKKFFSQSDCGFSKGKDKRWREIQTESIRVNHRIREEWDLLCPPVSWTIDKKNFRKWYEWAPKQMTKN